MSAVDPDDDAIKRYIVRRYAYDPSRHERRHQVVAAFDTRREFLRLIRQLNNDLEHRRAAGQPVDHREYVSGVCLEPGYKRRQRDGRLLRAAIQHRADLSNDFLRRLDLPSNVAVLQLVEPQPGVLPAGFTQLGAGDPSSLFQR
jgi:hypothetical protein